MTDDLFFEMLLETEETLAIRAEKALDRKIKAMPDRSAIAALHKDEGGRMKDERNNPILSAFSPHPSSLQAPKFEREKILKTFRFFNAVANNDHAELRAIMQTYEPEYTRVLSPQVEGTNSAGGSFTRRKLSI